MRKTILTLLGVFLLAHSLLADEGMWLLKELNRQSAAQMKELGFTFPIDSLYNEQNPSLKDAVIIFGAGCTGVAVSNEGLVFTNHHCGYEAIQKLSSVEHDYLKDGFVSQSFEKELPCKDLTIQFLKKTEDVTSKVLSQVTEADDESIRDSKISKAREEILKEYEGNDFLSAKVIPFYSRNKYYLVVYEVFKDIRLVLTPPSSVGKFGGETDNWMWPRHTCDFSVFRVYANKENKPAEYNADNQPYHPRYSVPVSLNGYKEKDYAMTIGYPGRTQRYLSSWGITRLIESINKPRIEVRTAKQDIWKEAMLASDAVRIKYASKYARSSNYWKNAMGMNTALAKLHVVKEKQALENKFSAYLQKDTAANAKYGEALPLLEKAFESSSEIEKVRTYFNETFTGGIEIARLGASVLTLKGENKDEQIQNLKTSLEGQYKDYEPLLDKKLTPVLLKLYADRVPPEFLPDVYKTIQKKFKGDYNKYADWLFSKTAFTDLNKVLDAVKKKKDQDLMKDPAVELALSVQEIRMVVQMKANKSDDDIQKGERLFMAGLLAMNPDKAYSPDANFTQRLSYGSVGGYSPADAVKYNFQTTSEGVLAKVDHSNPEFDLQDYLVKELESKDFGQYGQNGTLYTCFLSNNDITGGNSGSPVFNGKAELIGLAFDGNWEALSGDIVFEPKVQRTISVDIRYVLYTIDKLMKCPRLIQELKLQK
jgi:hypothetical protein